MGFFYSFYFESERGLFPNTEYVYDLELPLDFVPKNADGEVETFELLTAEECIQRALSPHFKTTSAPVLLDFLIRKGYINPENGRLRTSHTISNLFQHAKNCSVLLTIYIFAGIGISNVPLSCK